MNKAQILILLLIIALVFYYLNEEPKSPPVIKKPPKPQPPKPTYVINLPVDEPITKWPSNTPIIELPSATWVVDEPSIQPKPVNFGLNPPHSQVDEPWEPPETSEPTKTPEPTIKLPSDEPQPIKATLNCPAAEFIPANEPALNKSELTAEEKSHRLRQELSDYHWLLNNKTITDWHYEQNLTSTQYQVLKTLVNQEEMNTLSYFLNLLPTNYEWLLISPEFKDQPALIAKWQELGFSKAQTQDWLKIGLEPTDYALAAWLKNVKNLTAEAVLNFADLNQLKEEFAHYGN